MIVIDSVCSKKKKSECCLSSWSAGLHCCRNPAGGLCTPGPQGAGLQQGAWWSEHRHLPVAALLLLQQEVTWWFVFLWSFCVYLHHIQQTAVVLWDMYTHKYAHTHTHIGKWVSSNFIFVFLHSAAGPAGLSSSHGAVLNKTGDASKPLKVLF